MTEAIKTMSTGETISISTSNSNLRAIMRFANSESVAGRGQFYVRVSADFFEIKKCRQPVDIDSAKAMHSAHRGYRRSLCRFCDSVEFESRQVKRSLQGEVPQREGRNARYDFGRLLSGVGELQFTGNLQQVRTAARHWATSNNCPLIMKTFGETLCVRLSPYEMDSL